jgi:hypothetical protein
MAGKEEGGSFVMPCFSNHAFRDFDPDNFVAMGSTIYMVIMTPTPVPAAAAWS